VSQSIKPTHKSIATYYEALKTYKAFDAAHEGATETAFSQLLASTAGAHGWTLIPKQPHKVAGGKTIFPDGTLRDLFNLQRGHWEAKDTSDDLDVEIQKKIKSKYPLTNTIFEDTRQAVLFQNRKEVARYDLTKAQAVADLLNQFYSFTEPDIEGFEQAVAEFLLVPRRGCIPQPRVALRAPWERRASPPSTLKGLYNAEL
jgi:hypothetical protein